MDRRSFLSLAPFGASVLRRVVAQSARAGSLQSPAEAAFFAELQSQAAALSRALPGRDFEIVRWFGAAPGDVNDGWHLALMNRGSQPVHTFLFEQGGPPRKGQLLLNGEARDVSQTRMLIDLPSDDLATRIPNPYFGKKDIAVVDYGRSGSDIAVGSLATELQKIARHPLDAKEADYFVTPLSAQPKLPPGNGPHETRWKTPGIGKHILRVSGSEPDKKLFLVFNTDLATVKVGSGWRYRRNSPLGPYLLRAFPAAQLGREAFVAAAQRDGSWRRLQRQILEHQKTGNTFPLQRLEIERQANRWVAVHQEFSGLRRVREDGRLRISDYFMGG